jgi:riboflavin synthase
MFTGIVEEMGNIVSIDEKEQDKDFIISSSMKFNIGDSVSVNGVCLTVREQFTNSFKVSAAYETLKLTNLSLLKVKDPVNLENSLTLNKALGGHLVQGHVADTSIIINKRIQGESIYFRFSKPEHLNNYIVKKGYIAVDGMSLTICEEGKDWFEVMLIPHTLSVTIAGNYTQGSKVNLEVDIFARYIEKLHGDKK